MPRRYCVLKQEDVCELAYSLRLPLFPACIPPPITPTRSCPPVCLASGSDTQYPHCVAVLQQGRKKSTYQQSLPSTALFCAHTKKQLPDIYNSRGNSAVKTQLIYTCCVTGEGCVFNFIFLKIFVLCKFLL